jgi:DNA-directed RNA polymerase sigma subunit (sigma70/sigma32)
VSEEPRFTGQAIAKLTARKRAILKLRFGGLALAEEEMAWVLPEHRSNAQTVHARSLGEVAAMIGVTKERIRQIVNAAFQKTVHLPNENQREREQPRVT